MRPIFVADEVEIDPQAADELIKDTRLARGLPSRGDEMTPILPRRLARDGWWMLSTIGLASLFVVFAWVHFSHWRDTGEIAGLGLVIRETIIVTLFVFRRRAKATSRSPMAWVAAMIGGWGIVLASPDAAGDPVLGLGAVWGALQFIGVLGAALSLAVLGRSFGVVAANRGVRTWGPYSLVRHPAYASYVFTDMMYLLENPSVRNIVVVLITTGFQFLRIVNEEAVLNGDSEYLEYRERVRYRLIPFLY